MSYDKTTSTANVSKFLQALNEPTVKELNEKIRDLEFKIAQLELDVYDMRRKSPSDWD